MNKKKLLLTALALVLVCTVVVAGALAFLKDTSSEAKNTFIAAGGGRLVEESTNETVDPSDPYNPTADNGFNIVEHAVETDEVGNYTLGDVFSNGNVYEVLPGAKLPKDPKVYIKGKTSVPSYLYIEVVDGLANSGLIYSIADCWVDTGLTIDGNKVYVYSADGAPVIVTSDLTVSILTDDQITVPEDEKDIILSDDGLSFEFYGFLAQASAGETAADVFAACFTVDAAE